MTLSWLEIGACFPDAVVLWDRDVAPTLDWEPRFREVDGVLWAVHGTCLSSEVRVMEGVVMWWQGQGDMHRWNCKCLAWRDDTWISERAYQQRQLAMFMANQQALMRNLREQFGVDFDVHVQRQFNERVREYVGRIMDRTDVELDAYGPMIRAIQEPPGDLYPDDRLVRREAFRVAGRILRMEERYVPPEFDRW